MHPESPATKAQVSKEIVRLICNSRLAKENPERIWFLCDGNAVDSAQVAHFFYFKNYIIDGIFGVAANPDQIFYIQGAADSYS